MKMIFLITLSLLLGCGRPTKVMNDEFSSLDSVDSINFEKLNSMIFTPKCATCHQNFTNYDGIMAARIITDKNPEASPLYQKVASGQMPQNGIPLSDTEVKAIYNWISAGSPKGISSNPGTNPPGTSPPGGGSQPPGGGSTTPEPTFAWIQANVFNARCVMCHRGASSPGGYDLTSFANATAGGRVQPGDAAGSLLFQRVNLNQMPPGNPLSAEVKQMIQTWIQNGAKNDGTVPPGGGAGGPPPLPPLEPKFSSIMANIVGPRCLACHDSVQRKGGVVLQDYRNLMRQVVAGNASKSEFYEQVQENEMPASGGPLNFEQKETIRQWINKGAPND